MILLKIISLAVVYKILIKNSEFLMTPGERYSIQESLLNEVNQQKYLTDMD